MVSVGCDLHGVICSDAINLTLKWRVRFGCDCLVLCRVALFCVVLFGGGGCARGDHRKHVSAQAHGFVQHHRHVH